jgi:hypothetical protein
MEAKLRPRKPLVGIVQYQIGKNAARPLLERVLFQPYPSFFSCAASSLASF